MKKFFLCRFQDDLLFWLFYNFPGDLFQVAAAAELYDREWRFHTQERVWITRALSQPVQQDRTSERGECVFSSISSLLANNACGRYVVFDPRQWKRVNRTMTLEYAKLENNRPLPYNMQAPMLQQQQTSAAGGGSASGTSSAAHYQQQYQMQQQQHAMMMQHTMKSKCVRCTLKAFKQLSVMST